MIWLRRGLVLPLGILFFVALLSTLFVFRLNGTILSPGFYADQLQKADIYQFLVNDLLASGIDEVREKESYRFDENPLVTAGLTTQEMVDAANRAIPPQWLQEQIELTLDEIGGHLTGRRDDSQITIQTKERATQLVIEARDLLIEANSYDLFFDEVVEPKVEEALEDEGVLPFSVPLTSERLLQAVKEVIPKEWVEEQVVITIDKVTPYAVGNEESFEIRVDLANRADAALKVTKDLLRESEAYQLLYDELIAPKVLSSFGQTAELPYGIEVSDEEVLSAMKEVAPPDWVQQQVEMAIDEAGPYLVGREDHMQITISLLDNKRNAIGLVESMVEDKLMTVVEQILTCEP